MPSIDLADEDLLGYLEESLPVERMSIVESALRSSESLRQRAAMLLRRRDDGFHSVGDIWRRHRLSCPSRRQLGSFLLEALDQEEQDYIDFHLRTVGCRYCAANLRDLEESRNQTPEVEQRRRKFFQTSAGHVKSLRGD
ncbi:hypothetical protein CA54_53320 [Symmachiella macrocystis]|uniref:Uncharacterized protein n=1 Tax=Symmachiella macrocystis TaxID=2527985 RepID=A0A5C6B6H0_9PLAN|nr:hypothetical protein [Symmachiella macrocystis]TWU06929.1 hypothetical protein CA54_53320 [Symmachiella macrocystis]